MIIINGVHDAVIPNADLPSDWSTATLLGASPPRIICQLTNSSLDPLLHFRRQFAELPTIAVG